MLQQQYQQYTAIDHQVWSILYARQLKKIQEVAYEHFATGIKRLKFNEHFIPNFTEINQLLKAMTGWEIYAVPGLIPNTLFFERMYSKQFGAATWIRKMDQLDYLEEPDMFHDVFGHIPLLTDERISHFLHGLAKIAIIHLDNEEIIESLSRLYWYTIEFGLVQEKHELKIYGAGILSSIGETNYCLSNEANRIPFNLEEILNIPYIKDKFQEQYFVLSSMEQLNEALTALEKRFNRFNLATGEEQKDHHAV